MKDSCWFHDWFNSPYYHLLYNNRNDEEAKAFIERLCRHLQLSPPARVWDLACGKGRHSNSLAELGLEVTGTDLSDNNIRMAIAAGQKNTEFFIHDMRTPFRINYFVAVFNLFTSIGYFEDEDDNVKVFRNIHSALKKNGTFTLDFLNAENVKKNISGSYSEKRGEMEFLIKKRIENNRVIKRIEFSDQGQNVFHEEKVSLLDEDYFRHISDNCGLQHVETFGDYELNAYDQTKSPRLIMIFKKQ